MNSNHSNTPGGNTGNASAPQAMLTGEEQGPNPLMIVHRALRGRYFIAAGLALVLGLGGAVAGYSAVKPKYSSRAVITIRPTLPAILYETELNTKMPGFEAFVSQQAATLEGSRVRNAAHDLLKPQGWPLGTQGLNELEDAIDVRMPRNANQVVLTVTHADRGMAQKAATALKDSYRKLIKENEDIKFNSTNKQLQELADEYKSTRDAKRATAMELINTAAGVNDLQFAKQSRYNAVRAIDSQIASLVGSTPSNDGVVAIAPPIAPSDQELLRLAEEAAQIQQVLRRLRVTLSEEHREVKRLRRQLEGTELAIQERRIELGLVSQIASEPSETGSPTEPAQRDNTMQARMTALQNQRALYMQELSVISQAELKVLVLREEADEANTNLEQVLARREALRVEQEAQKLGRIEFTEEPDLATRPSEDKRVQLAAAGFVGGAGFGVLAIAGLGFLSPKIRVADDVAAIVPDVQILAMIPDVTDPWAASSDALESVHLMRVMLDARLPDVFTTICLTSPTSGEGKSTLSYLLARSYGAAGRRVLLVDADLVGRRLTTRFGHANAPGIADALVKPIGELIKHADDIRVEFVPAGSGEETPEEFCQRRLRKVIDGAKAEGIDLVVIDTGPVLGSLDAAAAVPMADQTLLIASRGVDSRPLRVALSRLRDLNARRIGIVFNRATMVDIAKSASPSMSRRSMSALRSTRSRPAALQSGADSAA